MKRNIPNLLTVGRLVLAIVFFILLSLYDRGSSQTSWILSIALIVCVIALVTDYLDGILARKWNAVSAFGRIVDPFVDKVLVVGAFIMFTGSNFAIHLPWHDASFSSVLENQLPAWTTGRMITAVQPWMVVVIMIRELSVTVVRSYCESVGIKFPATPSGKFKMLFQSVVICFILLQLAYFPDAPWAVYTKVVAVWLTVLVVVASGMSYVRHVRKVLWPKRKSHAKNIAT